MRKKSSEQRIVLFLNAICRNISKVSNGTKCQLRSEMLHIYYKGIDKKTIRQYEYENFLMLYEAYKALKGNSFVDKIKAEVDEWQVVT